MDLVPLADKIIVKIDNSQKTKGGLYISSSEKKKEGEVVAVGCGVYYIKVGDIAYFDITPGIPLEDDYHMYSEKQILALRKKSDT